MQDVTDMAGLQPGARADFAAVGMFDFQIAEDVAVANAVLKTTQNRDRKWFGSNYS